MDDDHAASMTTNFPVLGTTYAIAIEGDDARYFAQSQFCGDATTLGPGHWQWNAWLTPVGKVRALMHLAALGDGSLLMVLRGGDASEILADLRRYILRAHVQLSLREFTARAGAPLPSGEVATDAGITLGYGPRSQRLDATSTAPIDVAASNAWRLADIEAGWPTLPAGEPEFLPPALGLEHLGAIAFDKGCYPGQEMASRLHFRGGHKRRLCHLRGAQPLATGPAQTVDGVQSWILDAVADTDGCDALAVISDNYYSIINVMGNIYTVVSIFNT